MRKLYENFHIFRRFQKRIVSAETIRRNPEFKNDMTLRLKFHNPTDIKTIVGSHFPLCIALYHFPQNFDDFFHCFTAFSKNEPIPGCIVGQNWVPPYPLFASYRSALGIDE